MTNKELIQWYRKGYKDEERGTTSVVPEEAEVAYSLGAIDYLAGEEKKSDQQVLDRIKGW